MVLFNYTTKEMTAKIVYYGPGLCGKTTNLQYIHRNLPKSRRGDLVTLPTETDRTLFFDLLPLRLGKIGVFTTRMQLYTVPGQVFYNSTRKMVLRGVDGIVFVADSQVPMRDANIESLENLEENLAEHKLSLRQIPWILQYNKRDLPNILPVSVLNSDLNRAAVPWFEAIAITGVGVITTLKAISKMTLQHLRAKAGYVGIRDKEESTPKDVAIVSDDEDRIEDQTMVKPPPSRAGVAKPKAEPDQRPAAVSPDETIIHVRSKSSGSGATKPSREAEERVIKASAQEVAPSEEEVASAAPDGALTIVRKLVVPVRIRKDQALNGIKLDLRIDVQCSVVDESGEAEEAEERTGGYSW